MPIEVIHADCTVALRDVAPNSIDACVTDPPYHIEFMGKRWDGGDVAFRPETWRLVFEALKPGGHLLAFGGTRTYHRMAVAIEDAGFQLRDMIAWLYGSGFPKSLNLDAFCRIDTQQEFDGWGTALKPALEPICLARKPLIGTVAANVLAHGTGAINIDGCRVEGDVPSVPQPAFNSPTGKIYGMKTGEGRNGEMSHASGRWPANVIHDGSAEVVEAFPDSIARPVSPENIGKSGSGEKRGMFQFGSVVQSGYYDAETSAARFFYSAKADAEDRLGSKHPTVKPVDLIAYLCRLVTPPRGIVLDPFAGSGTTGMACMREGFNAVLIEREAEYVADIKRRLAHVSGFDTPLFAEAAQ